MIANAVGENYENVHGVEAIMKKTMIWQLSNPLKIEETSISKTLFFRSWF